MATEVTFTKDDFAGQGTANTGSEVSATKDGVTFTYSKGYCADESLRCYAHGSLSITAETTIEKINFTTTGGKTGGLDAEVTVGATSYSVDDLASQARFTQIVVTLEGGEPVVVDTYTVAGNDAAIFGEAWNPALEANDMKKVGGIYTWEKAGLELAPNDKIEFKVVKNHSWDIAFPAENFEISADEEGVYTLRISFDPATEEVDAVLEGAVVIADPTNCAEAREAALSVSANNELYNDGKEYTIEGYVTSIAYAWANGSMSFWMADAADGGNVLEAYKCAIENEEDAVRLGDKVAVTGKLTKYNTTPEFAAGCTVVIIERAEVVEPKNLGEKTIAEFLELKNMVDTCILTGAIANVANDQYGNFDLVDETGSVYVYGLLTAAGESKKCFQEEGLAEGDILTVLAIYGEYNQNPQVKNAIFVSVEKQQGQGIEETATDAKAVKVVRNGQVYILRGDKTFNLIGAEVK